MLIFMFEGKKKKKEGKCINKFSCEKSKSRGFGAILCLSEMLQYFFPAICRLQFISSLGKTFISHRMAFSLFPATPFLHSICDGLLAEFMCHIVQKSSKFLGTNRYRQKVDKAAIIWRSMRESTEM